MWWLVNTQKEAEMMANIMGSLHRVRVINRGFREKDSFSFMLRVRSCYACTALSSQQPEM